jgi:hypothetical protein
MRKKVLKAHFIVWGGNLAYLVFACLFKNKCAKLWDSKNGFVKPIKRFGFHSQVY